MAVPHAAEVLVRVAVLTLTRDRLEYTKHCFATLRENSGCDFDWFVLDQGSTDGTAEWLLSEENEDLDVTTLKENIGITRGLNLLLDHACDASQYDVIVRFDNDCEVLRPNTLRTVAEFSFGKNVILAPRVLGLKNPPETFARDMFFGHPFSETATLGGIFMAIPALLFTERGFRYDERFPAWTGDEDICRWWRTKGGRCGYLETHTVKHYLTTDGQIADDPVYQARKEREMAAA